LLELLRHGSQEAAQAVYARYAQRLHALARAQCAPDLAPRMDPEDIVQSVFGSFFRGARQGYYDIPAGEDLWKIFLVIALNKIRTKGAFHRAAKRDVRRTCGDNGPEPLLENLPQDAAADSFLEVVVAEVLERLPAPHRQMVQLRMQGYDLAEIARQTGRSKRTVERTLQESRKKLGTLFQEHLR
jgi:RNA polymerase sigma-70 factor (ECF subfamily)